MRNVQDKIVIVTRETRADHLKRRFNTMEQAKFFVKSRQESFTDYEREDKNYKQGVQDIGSNLQDLGRLQFVDRAFLPNYVFGPRDIVVAIGQDGLVANTLKYLREGQPLIGVNPDPERWDGVLLPFKVDDLPKILPEVINRHHRERLVTMGEAALNDGQKLLAVNDFFIGQRSHTSARYTIQSGLMIEQHSSSGVIVSTGLGSTGWLTSLIQGATAIARQISGTPIQVPKEKQRAAWDAEKLYFTVREPFPSKVTQATLVFGEITPNQPLVIRSLMGENGVVFSDGIEADFVEFNSGAEATIRVSPIRGHLVVK